ncbi:hypothetical protein [Methylobacterium sp.]|jgi:hypothetical protein|uniref:hypothetical protein n=1 Tax=Methylobacterium sp. TaxID=409 RepID=UPI0026281344|nr:hypothetical protein [Methylobacterium sp.]MDB5646678.1 hypothetical protein [Methylobacterium sp.]
MTMAVSLNQVGVIRATEILHQARNDAARRHETEPKTVSVDIGRAEAPAGIETATIPASQRRVVDLRI